MRVEVFPVPGCMTPEDAFEEMRVLGYLAEQKHWWSRAWCRVRHGRRRWAVMEDVS